MEFGSVAKSAIQLALLATFLCVFGVPSVIRYFEKRVLTVTSERYPGEVRPPAITVVAFNSSHGGWKQSVPSTDFEALETVCGQAENITRCVLENSNSLQETVHAELGFQQNSSLMAPELWREDLTASWYGLSYTLVYPHPKGTAWRTDAINLHVNVSDGLTRRIFIHDPDFFLLSINPLALPVNLYSLQAQSGRFYFSIALTEHIGLNTPSNPCVEDPGYRFIVCVKESLSGRFGCRLPWDNLSSQDRQVCHTLAQFEPFAREYEVLKDASLREIIKRTGCHKPCKYKEYVVVNGPLEAAYEAYSFFSIEFWMLTTDITMKTEQLIYHETSLVAEFGGTLSLFLGVSFMTLWNGIERLGRFGRATKTYFLHP